MESKKVAASAKADYMVVDKSLEKHQMLNQDANQEKIPEKGETDAAAVVVDAGRQLKEQVEVFYQHY